MKRIICALVFALALAPAFAAAVTPPSRAVSSYECDSPSVETRRVSWLSSAWADFSSWATGVMLIFR
jgi:hypothetical protein